MKTSFFEVKCKMKSAVGGRFVKSEFFKVKRKKIAGGLEVYEKSIFQSEAKNSRGRRMFVKNYFFKDASGL